MFHGTGSSSSSISSGISSSCSSSSRDADIHQGPLDAPDSDDCADSGDVPEAEYDAPGGDPVATSRGSAGTAGRGAGQPAPSPSLAASPPVRAPPPRLDLNYADSAAAELDARHGVPGAVRFARVRAAEGASLTGG
jgi:hypothetical protein